MPVLFPDAVATVLTALTDATGETGHAKIPTGRTLADTFLLVRRVGGTHHDRVVDDASLTIEAWAPTDTEAHDLCQMARAYLHDLVGTVVDGVRIYQVSEFAGPAWLPDPDSEHPRYTMTAQVQTRGVELSGS